MATSAFPTNALALKFQKLLEQCTELHIRSAAQQMKSQALLQQIATERWYAPAGRLLHKQSLAELYRLEGELNMLAHNGRTEKEDSTRAPLREQSHLGSIMIDCPARSFYLTGSSGHCKL